jgi:hypothetical protein
MVWFRPFAFWDLFPLLSALMHCAQGRDRNIIHAEKPICCYHVCSRNILNRHQSWSLKVNSKHEILILYL